MSDRAVSETLGFVFVFTMIVTTVALSYALGFSGLQDTRDVERVNNAERAFDVLADNIADLSARGAPSRATEVKLAEATLGTGESVKLNVSIPSDGTYYSADVEPIRYHAESGSDLLYVGGAVIRDEGDGVVMVREPPFLLTPDRSVVPLIHTRITGSGVGGSTTVLIRSKVAKRTIHTNTTATKPVWINVTTPRTAVWERYLSAQPQVSPCSVTGNVVRCELQTDRVFVGVHKVDVAYE